MYISQTFIHSYCMSFIKYLLPAKFHWNGALVSHLTSYWWLSVSLVVCPLLVYCDPLMQDHDIPITNALTVPQSCTNPSLWCAYDLGMELSVHMGPDYVCVEWVPFIFHSLPLDDCWSLDSYSLEHLITLVFVSSVQSHLSLWIRMMYWCISLVWVSPGIKLLHNST